MNAAARPRVRFLAGLCLAALAVLAFWDVPRTGPTTSDDLVYEQAVLTSRIGALSAELAAGTGRFHHYLHVGLTALASHIDSLPLRKTLALAGFLGVIAALAVLAAHLARSPELGLLTAALAVGLYQDNWHHNILTAYPFVFDAGMLWLLGAGYALVRHGRTGRAGWLVVANIALFLAFCHFEAFVAYLPVLAGLVWLTGRGTARQRLMTLAAAFAVLPVYAAVYLGYRLTHPSQYAGNALNLASPETILKTVWAYSRCALPLGGFAFNIEYINRFPQATGRYVLTFGQYVGELAGHLSQISPAWPAMGLLAGGLTYYCLDRASVAKPRLLTWALCAYGVVCPNMLIALSAKYQEPAAGGLGWYVTSTFSFYAVAVGLALGGLALAGRLPARPRRMVAAGLGLAVGLAVLVNASVNASVRASKIAAGARWRVAALAAASPALAGVPDGAHIVSPDLYAAINIELPGRDYWTAYFRHRTGRTFTVTAGLDGADPATAPVYFLRRLSGLLETDTALVLARVTGLGPVPADPYAAAPDAPSLLADRATVVMDVSNRFRDVLFRDAAGWQLHPATAGGGRLSLTELAGAGLVPASMVLLPARHLETGETSPLTLRFGQGFSAPERSVTGDVIWAGDVAELTVANAGGTPVRLRLTATVVAHAPIALSLEGAILPGNATLDCTGLTTPLAVELDLPPGRHSLTLRARPASGGEKRFGLLEAQLFPLPPLP